MRLGKILIGTFFAASVAFTILSLSTQQLSAVPENIRVCDAKKSYSLPYKTFKSDELIPGKPAGMEATFSPIHDGKIQTMEMKVYKGPFKIWSQTITQPTDFKADQEFSFLFKTSLPSIVPHIKVTMNMVFSNPAKEELSCIAFELNF